MDAFEESLNPLLLYSSTQDLVNVCIKFCLFEPCNLKVVEALALGEEPPELEAEKDDLTKPQPFDDETVEKIVAFRVNLSPQYS